MAGARAAAEKALELGFGLVPSLEAMLRQGEFKFVPHMDSSGPEAETEVH
jgi:hypothetical protein